MGADSEKDAGGIAPFGEDTGVIMTAAKRWQLYVKRKSDPLMTVRQGGKYSDTVLATHRHGTHAFITVTP